MKQRTMKTLGAAVLGVAVAVAGAGTASAAPALPGVPVVGQLAGTLTKALPALSPAPAPQAAPAPQQEAPRTLPAPAPEQAPQQEAPRTLPAPAPQQAPQQEPVRALVGGKSLQQLTGSLPLAKGLG
ncbi:ATP-binding protein [Streptomyces carminius]|uniref:ATP-binding protein n=1 Tax=Streptomyces carminius TaxID=2665496 RepID=A0A2M8LXR4_9ACTN|nr:ATP-binding protein [Streptomyces carminius]PJE96714.1 ATP-binding protein [Streptomyces carminius]